MYKETENENNIIQNIKNQKRQTKKNVIANVFFVLYNKLFIPFVKNLQKIYFSDIYIYEYFIQNIQLRFKKITVILFNCYY